MTNSQSSVGDWSAISKYDHLCIHGEFPSSRRSVTEVEIDQNWGYSHCSHMSKIASILLKILLDVLKDSTLSIDHKFIILKFDSSGYFLNLWTLANI